MKNNLSNNLFIIIFLLISSICSVQSNEYFVFDVTEIEVLENGNKILGKKGGTAKTKNNLVIYANDFEYDKIKNILYASGEVKIEDKIKNLTLFSEQITYFKNEEIILSNSKSKLISEKLTIASNGFKFNKLLNILEAYGNVDISDKINGYFGEAEKVTYFKNDEKIVTSGETSAFIKSKYNFKGSDVTIFRNDDKLTSLNKSTIIDTKFTQYDFDQFVYNFNNEFLKAKNVTIISNNLLPLGQSDRIKFHDGFFDLKNKNYSASKTIVKIKKDSFDNTENDPRIVGVSSESIKGLTKINKAVFTSCKVRNNKCPPWSIKAEKIMHDKEKKQLIYDQAILRVYDKPVMYFPKFFHPDPSVKRQSGFIKPQINNSEILGSSIFLPYFHIISDSKDATFKPTLFDSNIQMYQVEYRQKNLNSSFVSDVNLVKGYKSSSLNKKSTLTHFFSKYDLDLKFKNYVESLFSFFIEKSNNDTYLKVFDTNLIDIDKSVKPKNYNSLHSGIKIDLEHNDFDFSTGLDLHENLSVGNTSDRYTYVFPYYNFSKSLFSNNFGSINLQSSGSNKLVTTNNLRSRVINDLDFNSYDFFSKQGFKNNFNIHFKNLNTVAKNDLKYKSSPSMEIASIYEINSSFPMIKKNKSFDEYLEPKISFRINPSDMIDNSSNKRLINTDNIFDINRLGIIDSFEGGKSLTIGIDYKKEKDLENNNLTEDINKHFEIKLATVFRDSSENLIPESSTINRKSSNIFGSIKNNYVADLQEESLIDSVKLDYYFSIDNDLNTFEYNSFNTEVSVNKFTTSLNFIKESGAIGDSSFIENKFSYIFDDSNQFSLNTRRNRKINLTEYYDLVYEYKNDCLTAGIKYKKTYYQDRDLKPTEDLLLTFTFYPLTTYEQEIDQDLYRN